MIPTNRRMTAFEIFPFLAIPVLIYNLLSAFSGNPPAGSMEPLLLEVIRGEALSLPMLSGAHLSLGWGDLLLLFAIICLLAEVIKATRTTARAIMNHMLSMALFVLCLIEFLLLPSFATPTFFLMTMIILLDAMAGMVVTIISARRDFDVGGMSA